MKKRMFRSPVTLGFDLSLVALALLVASCGGAFGPSETADPIGDPPVVDVAIAELDSLITGVGSDILSVMGDLAADGAALAAAAAGD